LEPRFDLVGVGLNAVDTLVLVPHFPAYGGKVRITREVVSPGGQVASAVVAAATLGLRTKYVGTVGNDDRGRMQAESLRAAGIDLSDLEIRSNCATQSAYIIVDQTTGERTVFWTRPDCLAIPPERITTEQITSARMLHIDGHDTPAVERAASIARNHAIPVCCDVDTIYSGFDRVLPLVDYLIASSEFPARWTGERDPFRALEMIQHEHGTRVAAMTLGADGVLARADGRFHYAPGFVVDALDTTGAGDVFHGAFCYSVMKGMSLGDSLDFSGAMAALNCTALGARGGLATLDQIRALIAAAPRRRWPEAGRL
jgi:sugar/nucleoside kinase (ribokinase family)